MPQHQPNKQTKTKQVNDKSNNNTHKKSTNRKQFLTTIHVTYTHHRPHNFHNQTTHIHHLSPTPLPAPSPTPPVFSVCPRAIPDSTTRHLPLPSLPPCCPPALSSYRICSYSGDAVPSGSTSKSALLAKNSCGGEHVPNARFIAISQNSDIPT
jgi:hypothetical protein